MRRAIPWIILAVFGLEVLFALRPQKNRTEYDLKGFGSLPVLLNGRVQPWDSVARNSLLQIRGTQDLPLQFKKAYEFWKHPPKLRSTEWLAEVLMRPKEADDRYIFLIHHPELLGEFDLDGKGVEKSGLRYYRYTDLEPVREEIENQARQISPIDDKLRTPVQKQLMHLRNGLTLYERLKASLQPPNARDFSAELRRYQELVVPGVAALRAQQAGQEYDEAVFEEFTQLVQRFYVMANLAYPLIVPPADPAVSRDDWKNAGLSLMEVARGAPMSPAMIQYARMGTSYGRNDPAGFNHAVSEYRQWLDEAFEPEVAKAGKEFLFNNYKPFLRSMIVYLFAVLCGLGALATVAWPKWSEPLRRSAFFLICLGLVVHTAGLVFRMALEGRPPVTNLYSSAIFIGWGAVVLGLVLEWVYRIGIGVVVAGLAGFSTLIIAHNLAMSGDTMEMLRAVLDTNFWLATHVTVITLGYASTYVAGLVAILYILLGVFTPAVSGEMSKALSRMVYGILCFATLFSFVGTILGGIWADQSWGRFWGWDPKENGALIIVLWNAIILHARWGGMIRERGLMNMAVFGNVVTSFSWFGVNMLGIGLHAYGFMDAAFKWLMLFNGSQFLIIALGLLPLNFWMSFRNRSSALGGSRPDRGGKTKPLPAT